MTQIDKEAVERLSQDCETAAKALYDMQEFPTGHNIYNEAATMIRALRAALDAAEDRERAAVAAAYEKAADQWHETRVEGGVAMAAVMAMSDRIRALSDTDALAEYAEKVRAEERDKRVREGCAQVEDGWKALLSSAIARFEVAAATGNSACWNSVGSKAMADILRELALAVDAAIRQETNDG
jgi:hypothetical protein